MEAPIDRTPMGSAIRFMPPEAYPEPMRTRVAGRLAQAERELNAPFAGISAGTLEPDLFAVEPTGVSLEPVRSAAQHFVSTLSETQRAQAHFAIDAPHWRSWHNVHLYLLRHGVLLADLDDGQRDAALGLLRATLSGGGYATARGIMQLNEHVAELTGRLEEFGECYYYVSIFGTPSTTEPWGWQLDGHHLSLNAFVLGDQLVLTPAFMGSEPLVARSGRFAGTRVLAAEEAHGLAVMRALDENGRRRALLGETLPRDVLATALCDNAVIPYGGIAYTELDPAQRRTLHDLLGVYAHRIRAGHAERYLEEVHRHLDRTFFGWIGGHDDETPFYYRVHSPVVLIEFDHLPGVAYLNREPTRRHIHTVVRTPNGNDYGRDLLRRHYARHDHVHAHSPHLA